MMKCGTFEQLSSELCVFSNDWHAITNLKAIDTYEEWVDMRKKSTMSDTKTHYHHHSLWKQDVIIVLFTNVTPDSNSPLHLFLHIREGVFCYALTKSLNVRPCSSNKCLVLVPSLAHGSYCWLNLESWFLGSAQVQLNEAVLAKRVLQWLSKLVI